VWAWHVLKKSDVTIESTFYPLQNKEIQRVLQAWIKRGWVYLLAWAPWIGKSTLILQILEDLGRHLGVSVAYFSWEEQASEVIARRKRLFSDTISGSAQVFHAPSFEDIVATATSLQSTCIVVDSIQTVYSQDIQAAPWSVQQVKRCAEKLSEFGKKNNVTVFIIWHITKWGDIAWPKYLEHIVDVVLHIEWDRFGETRFLRTQKNRFWHTDDVGIFEMTLFGLQPVTNLTERLLKHVDTSVAWTVLTIWLDNGRPVMAHVEVLLTKTYGKYPSRTCVWVDNKRVDIICAVLTKYCNLKLAQFDVYIHVPWEFKFFDSWLDIAIAAAIYGHYHGHMFDPKAVRIGEIWLTWKVQQTRRHPKRKNEIPKGFHCIDYEVCERVQLLSGL